MSNSNTTSSGGISFFSALGLLFIGLKLANVINWSWWWVLAPFWGGIVLVLAIVAVYAVIVLVIALFQQLAFNRKLKAARKRDFPGL